MTLIQFIQLAPSIITVIGVIFIVYHYFRNPDIEAGKEIELIKQGCSMRHQNIDNDITSTKNDIVAIKTNHLKHIEEDLSKMQNDITRIFTILEERLPRK